VGEHGPAGQEEPQQPQAAQPGAVAVAHEGVQQHAPEPPEQVLLPAAPPLLCQGDAGGVMVAAGVAVHRGQVLVGLGCVAPRVSFQPAQAGSHVDAGVLVEHVVGEVPKAEAVRPRGLGVD